MPGVLRRLQRIDMLQVQSAPETPCARSAKRRRGCRQIGWSPLAGGFLSGKYSGDSPGQQGQAEEGSRRIAFDFPPVNKGKAWDCIDAMRKIGEA